MPGEHATGGAASVQRRAGDEGTSGRRCHLMVLRRLAGHDWRDQLMADGRAKVDGRRADRRGQQIDQRHESCTSLKMSLKRADTTSGLERAVSLCASELFKGATAGHGQGRTRETTRHKASYHRRQGPRRAGEAYSMVIQTRGSAGGSRSTKSSKESIGATRYQV